MTIMVQIYRYFSENKELVGMKCELEWLCILRRQPGFWLETMALEVRKECCRDGIAVLTWARVKTTIRIHAILFLALDCA